MTYSLHIVANINRNFALGLIYYFLKSISDTKELFKAGNMKQQVPMGINYVLFPFKTINRIINESVVFDYISGHGQMIEKFALLKHVS